MDNFKTVHQLKAHDQTVLTDETRESKSVDGIGCKAYRFNLLLVRETLPMTKWTGWFVTPKTARMAAAGLSYFITCPATKVLGSLCVLILMMQSEVLAVFPFPRPPSLEPNIKFWVDVFATYNERDFIIHDRDQVWRVYQVLRLPGEGAPSRSDINTVNDYLKEKYGNILNRLASGQAP